MREREREIEEAIERKRKSKRAQGRMKAPMNPGTPVRTKKI